HHGPEDLFTQQPVARILRLEQRRLDEVPLLPFRGPPGHDLRVLLRVVEVAADLGEGLLVDHRAHAVAEVARVADLDLLHDRDGAVADLLPDRLRDVDAARRRALLALVLEPAARDRDGDLLRI